MVYHDESTMSNEQPEKDTFKACLYWRTKVIGSWRPQQKRHLYNEFALFKNYNRSYSIPLNMSNVGKFFWRWIQTKYVWVQERERRSFSWLRAHHKTFRTRTSRRFIVVQLRPKKCTKKGVLHVQRWWYPFSLPLWSSLVKLTSNTDQSQHRQQLNEPISW